MNEKKSQMTEYIYIALRDLLYIFLETYILLRPVPL